MRMRRRAYFSGSAIPLASAVINSVTGTLKEGSTVTINCSWVGGTAPFTVTLSNGTSQTNVSDRSTSITTTAVAGVGGYSVSVKDALNVSVNSAVFPAQTTYIRVGTASYSFNTSTKVATFYANPSGVPFPSVAWYISINGGAWQFWSSSTVWSSGAFGSNTTINAYYVASSSEGSGTSNSVFASYQ